MLYKENLIDLKKYKINYTSIISFIIYNYYAMIGDPQLADFKIKVIHCDLLEQLYCLNQISFYSAEALQVSYHLELMIIEQMPLRYALYVF